jgi:hypothetical protein
MQLDVTSPQVQAAILRGGIVPATVVACTLLLACRLALGQTPSPGVDPAAHRSVHAVALQSNSVDGETSWIIEQDVPRIPKIAGLDRQLPPHIERRLSYAFDLAQRGATFTADSEFRAVLGLCALELDAREGGIQHREALRQGWIAIDEADQFGGDQVDWRDSADVRLIAVGHVTPALRNTQTAVDSIQAVQAYYAFAEERLAYSCHGLPGASLAFYGLARTFQVPDANVSHAAGKSALLHRVALIVAPQNVLAANELGVLLAHHGQLDEAQTRFQQSIAIDATPEAWRNLAVVYARQGNETASRSAHASSVALASRLRQKEATNANVPQNIALADTGKDANSDDKETGFFTKLRFMPKLTNPFRR